MKKINTTEKITFVSFVFFVLFFSLYVFLYRQIVVLNKDITFLNSKLATAEMAINDKNETLDLLNKTKDDRKKLESYFVSTENPTPFLDLIEETAKKINVDVEVQSLNVEFEDKEKKRKFIETSLSVKGTWDSVFRFISLLEHFPYVVNISNSTFTIDADEGDVNIWKGQITLLCSEI